MKDIKWDFGHSVLAIVSGVLFLGTVWFSNEADKLADLSRVASDKMSRLMQENADLVAEMEKNRLLIQTREGVASYYGKESGIITSIGEPFDGTDYTAASRDLPPGTIVIVESLETGAATACRINDYGPSKKYPERIIDISHASGGILGMHKAGLTRVRIHVVRLPKVEK